MTKANNSPMRTENENKCIQSACYMLNAYRKRKGQGFEVKPSDLLTLREVRAVTAKPALHSNEWHYLSAFIPVKVAGLLYRSLTAKARESLISDEVFGGWFGGGPADPDCDIDGDFCSTPSHSDDVVGVVEYVEDLEHCSEAGLLFIYPDKY
jgi:hypothetical protein